MAITQKRFGRQGRADDWRELYEAERRRLAMLWKAFEDMEHRVAELERELGRAPVPVVEEVEKPLERQPRYPIAVDKLSKIPGISKADVEKLGNYGVNLSDELLHADLEKLAEATGVERATLERYRDICELIAINGIGPKWAQRLVDAGITSIQQLAETSPAELEKTLLKTYEKEGLSEQRITVLQRTLPARSKKLIDAAKKAAKAL